MKKQSRRSFEGHSVPVGEGGNNGHLSVERFQSRGSGCSKLKPSQGSSVPVSSRRRWLKLPAACLWDPERNGQGTRSSRFFGNVSSANLVPAWFGPACSCG